MEKDIGTFIGILIVIGGIVLLLRWLLKTPAQLAPGEIQVDGDETISIGHTPSMYDDALDHIDSAWLVLEQGIIQIPSNKIEQLDLWYWQVGHSLVHA